MKKLLYIILMVFIIFTLAACGKNDTVTNIQNTHEIDSSASGGLTEPKPPASSAIGDIINFGGIDWRVLDVQGGRALIISQYILELRAFHDTQESVTWEHSDIRQYLNNEFFNSRFSDNERSRIAQTTIINHDNLWFGTDGGNNTNDRIFLLSLDELIRYFGDSGEHANRRYAHQWGLDDEYNVVRIAYTVADVIFTGEWSNLPPGSSFAWWLRSTGAISAKLGTGYGQVGMSYVLRGSGEGAVDFDALYRMTREEREQLDLSGAENEGGVVDVEGVYVTKILGIRPALWLNL